MTGKIYTDPLGRKHHIFSGSDFNELFGHVSGSKWDDDAVILIPASAQDDKMAFPSSPLFDDYYGAVRSGTVIHSVQRAQAYGPQIPAKPVNSPEGIRIEGQKGFAATALEIFREDDWYGECWGVMSAHGWLGPSGGIAQHIVDAVIKEDGPCALAKAKLEYGKNWEVRVAELAATHLVTPLSRLWYVINMKALYYCHHDDMRLGYLWAEYQMRLNSERDALRGESLVKSAKDGGLARRASLSARTQEIIASMERRIVAGQTIANAARLSFNDGHGTSPEANRKLWARRK